LFPSCSGRTASAIPIDDSGSSARRFFRGISYFFDFIVRVCEMADDCGLLFQHVFFPAAPALGQPPRSLLERQVFGFQRIVSELPFLVLLCSPRGNFGFSSPDVD